jgi:hypothetical protein
MYLKDLDDQIRQKKELLERERRLDHDMPSPPVQLDVMSRQRKQFPGETAKMFTSAVFPPSPHRNSFNPYMTLPPIHNASQEDLSMQSLFPPTGSDRTSFVRGAMNVAELPQWKQDELQHKEDQRKRQQKEIQDVLKQQIAEKEQLKQKQKQEQRLEDEKEQKRILQEQQELYARYAREKEEQRKKEEQEALEKQAKMMKQKQEQEQDEQKYQQTTSKSARAKRAQRPPTPEDPPMQTVAPVPFRSTSPPLPAVMKKMKEQGLEIPTSTAKEPSPSIPPTLPPPPDPSINRSSNTPFQEVRVPRTPILHQAPVQTITPKIQLDQQDTIKILEQLAQIQKVVLNSYRNCNKKTCKSNPTCNNRKRFWKKLMNKHSLIIWSPRWVCVFDVDEQLRRPKSGYLPREPPPTTRTSLSAKYRRFKDTEETTRDRSSLPSNVPAPRPDHHSITRKEWTEPHIHTSIPELTDTESQILSISRNLQLSSKATIQTPDSDAFNIDEIEKRNEQRLRLLQSTQASSSGDLLAHFVAQGDQAYRSIPTSPSTYQPLPFTEL